MFGVGAGVAVSGCGSDNDSSSNDVSNAVQSVQGGLSTAQGAIRQPSRRGRASAPGAERLVTGAERPEPDLHGQVRRSRPGSGCQPRRGSQEPARCLATRVRPRCRTGNPDRGRQRVRRQRVRRRPRQGVQDDQPRHRGGAGRGRRGRRRRRRRGREGRPPGLRPGLGPDAGPRAGQVPLPDRPDHPGARPRAAVLESIDNGKPIKESRDVDVPTAAAHFFYYAGWADKLEYSGYGTHPASASPARSSRGTSRC